MDIGYRCFVQYDVKKLVSNVARCGPDDWGPAKHIPDQIQDRGNGAERIVIMFKGRFLEDNHPGIDLVEIGMKRRISARVLAASVDLLLGGPVLQKLVWFLLEHKGHYFQENATQREYIRFLSLMDARTWLLSWLCLLEAKVKAGKVGGWNFCELLTLRTIARRRARRAFAYH